MPWYPSAPGSKKTIYREDASMFVLGDVARGIRPRPEHLPMVSLATLYQDYARIFMAGKHQREHIWETSNGHPVQSFDHNFFHLVKLTHPERPKFRMDVERELILQHVDGFGAYQVDQYRAKALPTAFDTLNDPDVVMEGLRADGSATHCFAKWYGGGPSPYTVALVKLQQGYFVPVTSFAVDRGRLKKICRNAAKRWGKAA